MIARARRSCSGGCRPTCSSTTGLGGGDWSPKDLVGHLETWEQHALDALEAFERDKPAPIAQQPLDTDALNLREVERKAGLSAEAIARSAATTHGRLLAALEALADERWEAPEARGNGTDGRRTGSAPSSVARAGPSVTTRTTGTISRRSRRCTRSG